MNSFNYLEHVMTNEVLLGVLNYLTIRSSCCTSQTWVLWPGRYKFCYLKNLPLTYEKRFIMERLKDLLDYLDPVEDGCCIVLRGLEDVHVHFRRQDRGRMIAPLSWSIRTSRWDYQWFEEASEDGCGWVVDDTVYRLRVFRVAIYNEECH